MMGDNRHTLNGAKELRENKEIYTPLISFPSLTGRGDRIIKCL
jgi:hypothetical protein